MTGRYLLNNLLDQRDNNTADFNWLRLTRDSYEDEVPAPHQSGVLHPQSAVVPAPVVASHPQAMGLVSHQPVAVNYPPVMPAPADYLSTVITPYKTKRFVITFGLRDKNTVRDYHVTPHAIKVGHLCSPLIRVRRNNTYHFILEDDCTPHAFILTAHPVGYHNGVLPQGLTPDIRHITQGKILFTVTSSTPKVFYYQCVHHPFEGSVVFVEDD